MPEIRLECHNCPVQKLLSTEVETLNRGAKDIQYKLDGEAYFGELQSQALNELAFNIRAGVVQAIINAGFEPTDELVEDLEGRITHNQHIEERAQAIDEAAKLLSTTRASTQYGLEARAAQVAFCLSKCEGPAFYGRPNSFGLLPFICQFPSDLLQELES